MKGATSIYIPRFVKLFFQNLQPNYSRQCRTLQLFEMTELEANDFVRRLLRITRITGCSFDDLFIHCSNIFAKGFAEKYDILRFAHYWIPLNRAKPELFLGNKAPESITAHQIKECLMALTNEGGLFH